MLSNYFMQKLSEERPQQGIFLKQAMLTNETFVWSAEKMSAAQLSGLLVDSG